MPEFLQVYQGWAEQHWVVVWLTLVAILYPTYLVVMSKLENIDWTNGEDFFFIGIAFPAFAIVFLAAWPIVLPAVTVIGSIIGFFHLNKRRILKKRNKDAVSKW